MFPVGGEDGDRAARERRFAAVVREAEQQGRVAVRRRVARAEARREEAAGVEVEQGERLDERDAAAELAAYGGRGAHLELHEVRPGREQALVRVRDRDGDAMLALGARHEEALLAQRDLPSQGAFHRDAHREVEPLIVQDAELIG